MIPSGVKYMHEDIVKKFNKRILIIRIVWIVICVVFLISAIIFTKLYDDSKVVIEVDPTIFGRLTITRYDTDLMPGMTYSWFGFFFSLVLFIIYIPFIKIKTTSLNHNYILLYRGFITVKLYINGKFQDELFTRFNKNYLEGKMLDGTRVTASLSYWGFHLTFSSSNESLDL